MVSLYAEDCGECHEEIFKEWRSSLHSRAFTDPFFQAYWTKDRFEWSCLTCHTPLENQLKRRVLFRKNRFNAPEFEQNDKFDERLQSEGITCAVCHVRNGIIYGPFKKSVMNAPHAVGFDPQFLSEEICLRCHEVPAKKFSFLRSAICSTGNEWSTGPYKQEGYTCQTCHMPSIERPLVDGGAVRPSRQHLWKGGSKPEQVLKALSIRVTKEEKRFRVDIINSGAGHAFPTGDPDRKVFITATLLSGKNKALHSSRVTFERKILWKPVMIELSDTRLPPRATKTLFLKKPEKIDPMAKVRVSGVYQILSERARKKLTKYYGLKDYPPVRYTFLTSDFPVSEIPAGK
ncbi:MAG: hypothetical protein ACE5FU_14030 [Nitrospinota bacterium]